MIVVHYRPTADRADENQALVEAVFAELADTDPGGLRYATLRLADGMFVHIADVEGDTNPLARNAASAEFQQLLERREEGEGPTPKRRRWSAPTASRRASGHVPSAPSQPHDGDGSPIRSRSLELRRRARRRSVRELPAHWMVSRRESGPSGGDHRGLVHTDHRCARGGT